MLLQVRHPGERFHERHEHEWPLARTEWTKLYLDPAQLTMSTAAQISDSSVTYAGFGCGVTFLTEPLEHEVEITGPIAAKLWVSSATQDADLFLVVRAFTPDLKEVTFQGALDSHTPIAQGWLRCSHRKLDEKLTLPYRPYHTHDEEQKLVPGRPVSCSRGVIGWHFRCAAQTTFFPASPPPVSRRWVRCGPASVPSLTMIRATARRRFSARMLRCTPAPIAKRMSCCQSFP